MVDTAKPAAVVRLRGGFATAARVAAHDTRNQEFLRRTAQDSETLRLRVTLRHRTLGMYFHVTMSPDKRL